MLGRALRTVLVCDAGSPRNARARNVHAFLTRDGIPPSEVRAAARAQLEPYATVTVREIEVLEVRADPDGFAFTLAGGETGRCRKVLLATGVVDDLPALDGLDALYGTTVFHCPICDGWEVRGKALAAFGEGGHAAGLALELLAYSRDVVLVTGRAGTLDDDDRAKLAAAGILVREEAVARLEGEGGDLARIVFADGSVLAREALFFSTPHRQASDLAERLGCGEDAKGCVPADETGETCVRGVYVAGDASKGSHLVVVAAAEGALAGVALHAELLAEDRAGEAVRPSPSPP